MASIGDDAIVDFCDGIVARRRDGAGAPVLWIHGYTIDSTLWDELWDLLPEHAHIGVDMPGHGLSAPLASGRTLRGLGDQLAEAALAHGVRHVVGLSLGSMVALAIAVAQPRAFASLALGAPAIGGGPAVAEVGIKYRDLARLFAATGPGEAMRDFWMTSPPDLFRYAQDKPALWTKLAAAIEHYRWHEFSGPAVARLATEPQPLETIAAIRAATLILVGEHEFTAFRETAALLRSHMTDCMVEEFEGVGHLCMLESPLRASAALERHFARAAAVPAPAG
jgi:pimeloyl-ACP methyl ester carboxylesterase